MEGGTEIQMQGNSNAERDMRRSWSQRNRQVAPLDIVEDHNLEVLPTPKAAQSAIEATDKVQSHSGSYRNPLSLIVLLLHILVALAASIYLGIKGIQAAVNRHRFRIEHWYPQLATAAAVAAVVSCSLQAIVLRRPAVMIKIMLWASPALSFAGAMVLICTSQTSSEALGVALLAFSVCQALYSCWVTPRLKYASTLLSKAVEPTPKFGDLHHATYWTILLALLWTYVWIIGVLGAISQKYAALIVFALIVSLAWMMEVLRNVVHVTVCRVLALYYLMGMQSDTQISFLRALTTSLGSINLGSMLIPTLEALRVAARAINIVEGEDEFLFSCAHCFLRVMQTVFQFGNKWAFVQVSTHGKGFVKASQDTWDLIQQAGLEPVVNEDLTSSLSFLSGVAGGALCLIVSGSWTFATHKTLTATISLIAFLMGYFMTRITMAVPQALVSAYYVCYAENPHSRLYDTTLPARISDLRGRPTV